MKIQLNTQTSSAKRVALVKAPKRPPVKNVGVELDFYFEKAPTTLLEVKKMVQAALSEANVKANITPLNVYGPGGGNPNVFLEFKTLNAALKYLAHHGADESDYDSIVQC